MCGQTASMNYPNDDAFLDDLERRAFRYFFDTAHPHTGLIPDRAKADASKPGEMASVAAVGFGLTALAIGAERGWESQAECRACAERVLRTLWRDVQHEHGFFFHFVDMRTGVRAWNCEASSIDTALAVFGALSAGRYFGGVVAELALAIEGRVDWPWLLDEAGRIRHGWAPETGFMPWSWDQFSEHFGMTWFAVHGATRCVPESTWSAWRREPWVSYAGERFLHHAPLFVHQFPQAWMDWRGFIDPVSGVNFFANACAATRAQKQFCLDLRGRFPGFEENVWGLTSSDGAGGYVDWGGPPVKGVIDPRIDGTVVPCAVAGSLPFVPVDCTRALREMHARWGEAIYGPYGFADAFNPQTGWVGSDVIGIDQGITLLMAENLRTGLVWQLMEPWQPILP
jgi:hypothetical protein